MNNINKIFSKYKKDRRVNNIYSLLSKSTPSYLSCEGTNYGQQAFLLASIQQLNNGSHIFIANNKEDAARFQNTLEKISLNGYCHFFPDSFKRPLLFENPVKLNILERTETVNNILQNKENRHIIVTYPEALFEKVVDPSILDKNKILLLKNEDLDVNTIIEVLVEFGFSRVDFVYEPGQFSIRGGIVDIFSYGNQWPYRIELFDETIESIRTFNPLDQLSIRHIERLNIIPNINNNFTQQEKVSLLSLFDSATTIWIRDYDFLIDKLQECFEKFKHFQSNVPIPRNEENEELTKVFAFLYPSDIVENLKKVNLIFLNKNIPFELSQKFYFDSKPQPNFNKNFKLLIEDLEKKENLGYEIFLFTENTKQINRFYAIFEDLNSKVLFHPVPKAILEGFVDEDLKIACYTDHQIFQRFHKYYLRKGFTNNQAISLKTLRELSVGDFVTHIDHGVGRYSGLETLEINGKKQESVRLIYKNNDVLYVGINSLHKISRYIGKDGSSPSLSKIGGDAWKNLKRKTKRKIKDIAKELIKLYAKRKASKGHSFPEDGYLQNELEASFLFEDTPDQLKATIDMKADMIANTPMDRLICGDVGFGKTEVAIRGAFKAVVGGKQVAVLVPTTILALQHAKTFNERLKPFDIGVEYLNRFKTQREKTKIMHQLKEGKIDILIGTHALLNKKIEFKDLGLLIVDEEQKFGVAAKEKLVNLKINVDTLTLTATPIPRTLQFSLMGARDLSIIRTPPPNRQAIHTEQRIFNEHLISDSIYYEINRGGQVFFVHNRVKNLPQMEAMLKKLCPDISIISAHGQLDAKVLEKRLIAFINGEYDVLLCTNIIETGLDIPKANTIIINNAHQFGMSDLHQLRGRVGRSNQKAYCYLFAPPISVLTSDARKRLRTLEEFSDLGSGFHIAMRDLDIRGAGNLLGGEQSGFISEIGYETYQKILEESLAELKENEFKDLFSKDENIDIIYTRNIEVDTDQEMLIPDDYVNNIQERLSLYTELDNIENEESLEKFIQKIEDRFGRIPKALHILFDALRIRWICKLLGFQRLTLKKNKLRCYFIPDPQSPFFEGNLFQNILTFINIEGKSTNFYLKQLKSHLLLIKDDVEDLQEAKRELETLHSSVKTTFDPKVSL